MADGTKQGESTFKRLLTRDVGKHVEKKGKFSYLSWAYAISELRQECPTATWEVIRFPLPSAPHLRVPYCETPTGFFVEVAVTVDGVMLSQVHPVLDERNGVIKTPNAFDINRAIQRALAKAIALHGLGLNLYAGEDLPLGDDHDGEQRTDATGEAAALSAEITTLLNDLGLNTQAVRTNRVRMVLKRDPDPKCIADLKAVRDDLAKAAGK